MRIFAVFCVLLLTVPASRLSAAIDVDGLIESQVPAEKSPRALNSEDIPDINPNDPQPLLTPTGDFDQDGVEDVAVAGIFNLPTDKNRYFLLVGTLLTDPIRYETIFFKEYTRPVFLHKPGTTGEGDPGDQVFSASHCMNCETGEDFYWKMDRLELISTPWTAKNRSTQVKIIEPGEDVPEEDAELALKIVSALPDVQHFTSKLRKQGGALGVQIQSVEIHRKKKIYSVRLYEKKETGDRNYDVIFVELHKAAVVKRSKKMLGGF